MNIVIFGATGPNGRCLLEQALQQGHTITAFARTPAKLEDQRAMVRVVQGDVLDPTKVEEAVAGQDAVLSALGVLPGRVGRTLSEGTRNIIAAMQKHGARRLIVESSYGVADSWPEATLPNRALMWLVLRGIYADKAVQERYIRESELDWVIVRPPRLTHGPLTRRYKVAERMRMRLGLRHSVSRADVADFMLKCLSDNTWLRKTPVVAA